MSGIGVLYERRHNAGERQRQCAECGLWIWPSEMRFATRGQETDDE